MSIDGPETLVTGRGRVGGERNKRHLTLNDEGALVGADEVREPFDSKLGRLMVSLGPLTQHKYCTYSCPFCYVHSGFQSYAQMPVSSILEWVETRPRSSFDVIYVSGDTDSFAPPRQNLGMELLEALEGIDVDLLFTTRAIMSDANLERLAGLASRLSGRGRLLIGCVSISQWTRPEVEPKPIPAARDRIVQLRRFRECGVVPVLALRPFLPPMVVPPDDYVEILNCAASLDCLPDVVLGEDWFANTDLERRVFGESVPVGLPTQVGNMDFTASDEQWHIYHNEDARVRVELTCSRLGIYFSMRSRPAVEYLRDRSA